MSDYITNADSIVGTFPLSLAADINKQKLAESIAPVLAELMRQTDAAGIFTRINELDESTLDTLANDLKIDWYESEDSIEYKRKVINECIMVHKYKGTKYAVETALKGVYDSANVEEWWEYGGEPFHFRVTINDSSNDESKRARVVEKLNYYKNLRSVVDNVVFNVAVTAEMPIAVGARIGAIYKRIGSEVG